MAGGMGIRPGNAASHVGVGLDVFHPVVVHDTEVAAAEGFGHGLGHFGFCLDHVGTGFFGFGFHFLFQGYSHGTAFFCLGLGNVFVGIGLVHLEGCTDVAANIDVGNINGENLKGCTGIQSLAQYEFGDGVGVLKY